MGIKIPLLAYHDTMLPGISSKQIKNLIENESRRLTFEAAEFKVMYHQQLAVCKLAEYHNSSDQNACKKGIEHLELAVAALDDSHKKSLQFGLSDKGWYIRNINGWLKKEFNQKIKNNR